MTKPPVKKKKKKKFQEDIALQITPMASIFTVILVFLIKSVSLGVSSVTPSQDLTLPEVKESSEVFEGLKVEISPKAVMVDDKQALTLENFEFDATELADDGSFKSVNSLIEKEKGTHASQEGEAKALIVADVNTPYSTLKRVFASAANQGFFDLKLVVVEDK